MINKVKHRALKAGLIASFGLMCAVPAAAGPVEHFGGIFEVTGDFDGIEGITKKANFVYTADFTNWDAGTSGINPLEYIIAVEFNLTGNKVMSLNSWSTDADGGSTGGWDAGGANSSNNNGCGTFGTAKNAVCAEDMDFSEGTLPSDHQLTTGMLEWVFAVTFQDVLAEDSFTKTDNHIGAFFRKCSGEEGDRNCTGGLGLSLPVSFVPPPDPDRPVPVPGTLLLLGLGLFGLRLSRKIG